MDGKILILFCLCPLLGGERRDAICVVCQHCQEQLFKEDVIAKREGFSYHKKCHKCYVCSETNLQNAEVFQGVIFCCSCSQRIFQGCSSARRSKNGKSKAPRARSRGKRREREHKRAKQDRRTESATPRSPNGVIELARLAASTESDNSNDKSREYSRNRMSNVLAMSTELALQIGKEIYNNKSKSLDRDSKEIGMTTEVTQELLRQMNCPVVSVQRKVEPKPSSPTRILPKEKGDSRFNRTIICSDLRIAELGASTEIAHMALRKRSEVPVIIKSQSAEKAMASLSLSENQESDLSGENDEWLDSTYSLKRISERTHWLDRRIGSILKMPFCFFKKNILDRSSLITVIMSDEKSRHFILKRLKMLFHEEIVEHQSRGIKRLYSTINRRKTPYRMGWLNLMSRVSAVMHNDEMWMEESPYYSVSAYLSREKGVICVPQLTIRERIERPRQCKHFHKSHSYRCMRAQAMKLAGPTKSELACLRRKIRNILTPKFVRRIFECNNKSSAIMMSQACGSERLTGNSVRNAKSN